MRAPMTAVMPTASVRRLVVALNKSPTPAPAMSSMIQRTSPRPGGNGKTSGGGGAGETMIATGGHSKNRSGTQVSGAKTSCQRSCQTSYWVGASSWTQVWTSWSATCCMQSCVGTSASILSRQC